MVLTSELTLIECDRSLRRAVHGKLITESEAADRRDALMAASTHWTVIAIGTDVAHRARGAFPREPVRTLDAIHLATLVIARAMVPEIRALTLDERIRANAREMGFEVAPE